MQLLVLILKFLIIFFFIVFVVRKMMGIFLFFLWIFLVRVNLFFLGIMILKMYKLQVLLLYFFKFCFLLVVRVMLQLCIFRQECRILLKFWLFFIRSILFFVIVGGFLFWSLFCCGQLGVVVLIYCLQGKKSVKLLFLFNLFFILICF